jgi:hypothetical protein
MGDHHQPINVPTARIQAFLSHNIKFKNTLFILGMFTYTYERQDNYLTADVA